MNSLDKPLSLEYIGYIKQMNRMDLRFEGYDVFLASYKFNSIGANENNVKKFYTSAFFFKRKDNFRLNFINILLSLEDFGFYNLVILSVINDVHTS